MAGLPYTSASVSIGSKVLNGGLNSTAGPLNLQDNESSDLQNVDFDKYGSVLKRNGYVTLTTAHGAAVGCEALAWFEYTTSGTYGSKIVYISGGTANKMDSLANVAWSVITGGLTVTAGYHCDTENFLNKIYMTNGNDVPFEWAGSSTLNVSTVPTGLTTAKYVKQFNNYLFYANVTVSGTAYPTRIYWSGLNDTGTWDSADWIEISKNDGQEITGLKVLCDRLVIFKTRSIYNLYYTGDADIPFTMPGGGKSNSSVGCIAPFSIQEIENTLVFLAMDGIYYYDGLNAYKISQKISTTLQGYNLSKYSSATSCVYKSKNRYLLAMCSSGQTEADRIVVWDYFNNAFSIYVGLGASAMATFFKDNYDERPYFADYDGYVYRSDYGRDDYPLNVQTAVNAYYYTNWKSYDDLCSQKGVPNVYIYYAVNNAVLTFAYSYDFESSDQYIQTMNMAVGTDVYGSAIYGVAKYAGAGGASMRRDLTGRGRVVRFKFANANKDETFRVDGFGSLPYAETNV